MEMGYAADLHREALIATAVVLFVFILIINLLFSILKEVQTMSAKTRSMVRMLVYAGAASSMMVLLFIVGYILYKGIPHLSPKLCMGI